MVIPVCPQTLRVIFLSSLLSPSPTSEYFSVFLSCASSVFFIVFNALASSKLLNSLGNETCAPSNKILCLRCRRWCRFHYRMEKYNFNFYCNRVFRHHRRRRLCASVFFFFVFVFIFISAQVWKSGNLSYDFLIEVHALRVPCAVGRCCVLWFVPCSCAPLVCQVQPHWI